jgi:anti-sigma regulatory factor (Ser/Thr protein kinase)
MHSPRHRVQEQGEDDPADTGQAESRPADSPGRWDARAFELARLTWEMDRQAAATFPGVPQSVATARRFVRITGAMWRLRGTLLDDIELCMSELVGNAVTHTATDRVHCRLWSARDVLFLEVDDEGRLEMPQVGTPGTEDEHGRGMLLVETFAVAWGTAPRLGSDGVPGRLDGTGPEIGPGPGVEHSAGPGVEAVAGGDPGAGGAGKTVWAALRLTGG